MSVAPAYHESLPCTTPPPSQFCTIHLLTYPRHRPRALTPSPRRRPRPHLRRTSNLLPTTRRHAREALPAHPPLRLHAPRPQPLRSPRTALGHPPTRHALRGIHLSDLPRDAQRAPGAPRGARQERLADGQLPAGGRAARARGRAGRRQGRGRPREHRAEGAPGGGPRRGGGAGARLEDWRG